MAWWSAAVICRQRLIFFNRDGETSWHAGHPIKRIDNGRLVSSLFGLSPSTSYNIKVINGITEIVGKVTTQPDELQFTPTAILYVNGNAAPGGNGSQAVPFKTIQEGVNHATPGTQVLVADGIYQENVSFPASGAAGNWIQVKAEGSGAILDGSKNLAEQFGHSSGKVYGLRTLHHPLSIWRVMGSATICTILSQVC